jgi:hypothetical protein
MELHCCNINVADWRKWCTALMVKIHQSKSISRQYFII